jgi:sugar phosphate permease
MKKTLAPSRWYRLLPVIFITYSLAYLDRANFSFGAAGGMAEDLHITKTMSSWLGSLFFLGYFLFQIPGVHYAAHRSAKKLIFWSLILWGLFATLTGIISNITILAIIRFLLGVVESAVFPSMLLLLSRWFTRAERSRANALLIFGGPSTVLWMSILSGYLLDTVGWRGMFIWEGVPAILWAICWWLLIDNKPRDAKWMSEEEKNQLEEILQNEQKDIKPVKNYLAAFKSRTVILLALQYGLWSIGIYGFVLWLPSMIKEAPGLNIVQIGWLSAIPYVMAVIGMIVTSYFSDKTLKRKIFVWPSLLVAAIAFYGSYAAGTDHFWIAFVLLTIAGMTMYMSYGPFWAIITEILPANVAGVSMALINSLGALGGFAGSFLVGFLNGIETIRITDSFSIPGSGAAYLFLAGSLFTASMLTVIALKNTKKV